MSKLLATWARTIAAPAVVEPLLPNEAPRSLISISAKKLSDGVLVSRSSVDIRGEWTSASSDAPAGTLPEPMRVRLGTLTCAARNAAANCCAANSAGWVWNAAPLELVYPRSYARPLSNPSTSLEA